jgi:hypothetical protein
MGLRVQNAKIFKTTLYSNGSFKPHQQGFLAKLFDTLRAEATEILKTFQS